MIYKVFATLFCAFSVISALPARGYGLYPSTGPRTVMFGSYYGPSGLGRTAPDSPLGSFYPGDTISTNAYIGDQFNPFADEESLYNDPKASNNARNEFSPDEEPQFRPKVAPKAPKDLALDEEAQLSPKNDPKDLVFDEEVDASTRRTQARRGPKRKPQKPSVDEEESDDEQNSWPFNQRGKNTPNYNAFFPIMIGQNGGAKSRSGEEGGYPGGATAIANSFSTGKGGVATSHATSYGDPYLSTLMRNNFRGQFNSGRRVEKPSQDERQYF